VLEYALILPLLLLLLLGIAEFGWAVFAYNTVANAGREVARCCIYPSQHTDNPGNLSKCDDQDLDPTWPAKCEQGAIARFSTAVNLQTADFGYEPDPVARTVRITVDYNHRLITGYIALVLGLDPSTATFTCRTAATMGVE
jgi:hypothetical protein